MGAATAPARVFGKKRAQSTRAESKGEGVSMKEHCETHAGHEVAGSRS